MVCHELWAQVEGTFWIDGLIERGYIVPLGLAALGVTVAIVSVISAYWSKMRQAEIDASLKHKMLDQGMSADDIKKILEASASDSHCGEKSKRD